MKKLSANMKKIVFIIVLIGLFTVNAYAKSPEDELISSMEGELSEFEQSLPDYIKDILPDDIFSGEFSPLTKGEINSKTFFDTAIDSLLAGIPSVLSSVALILAAVIISSVFNTASNGLNTSMLKESYNLCSSLCISLSVFNLVSNLSSSVISYMRTLCTVMNTFAPVMTVINIFSGKLSTAALGNASMMMFIALVENVLLACLVPIISVSLVFSIIKSISGDSDIGGISKLVKNTFITLTVFTMMIFSFVFSFQSTLTQSADSLSMKTAKFAVGSFIPIVGPSISEALRTVTSSIALIKNCLGALGMICVLLLTLPIVISVYLHKLCLDICASLSGMIGCEKEKGIISDASGICGFILAMVACTGMFFIFILSIFIKSSVGV